ncbi:baseplate J/gp47 family protein [Dapis sp. BLCC M229]|uniref:baseplate J/gp47 family protein n=1 Tax=Dapis sp. BLCC M229 TaxID=3400188 RepID=UPI003CEC199F
MAFLPPKIDQRTYEEIVEQTKEFAQQFTDWQPTNETGKIDAGEALIRIFGKMIKLVSDRLNKVPEKNFLVFLNLIGGELIPPQPAKVPLTFYLAEGSAVDGLVPAYTQVSAPPAEGSDEEIVFETDLELVVTTAQLKAVFVREPSQDKYSDRSLAAIGEEDGAFLAFAGDRPIEHSLYITCPEIFNLPELPELKLIITTDNITQFPSKLNWFYWDDSQWQEQSPSRTTNGNELTFSFTNLPIPTASEIQGETGKWLKANLTNVLVSSPKITDIKGEINITKSDLVPDVCLFNSSPLDLTKDFYPFGEQPEFNDTFYIALHEPFIKPNTIITLGLRCKSISDYNDLNIVWEISDGEEWKEITTDNGIVKSKRRILPSKLTPSPDFTREITAILEFSGEIPLPSTVNGETRYWIRARIKKGHYGQTASEREYPFYEHLAVLAKEVDKEATEIEVDNLDLFKVGDSIRLLPNTEGFPEEHTITEITQSSNKLTLNSGIINDNLAVGTRVMRKLIITETIPPTYDPPLIQSLKLSYKFTITEEAIYFANNDFIYTHAKQLTTNLKAEANQGDKLLTLAEITGLTVGQFLTIEDENYQIEAIDSKINQVLLTSTVKDKYPNETSVEYIFQPFTPTVDKDHTLYLGFDRSFENKTVTLYAQVEPPFPEELSRDITSKTVLTEAANSGEKILKLSDITGWEIGDEIEIQNLAIKQYDKYEISNIDELQITVNQTLEQNYSKDSRVVYPKKPELVWEYSSPLGWQPLGVKDETKGFSQRGLIQFIAPIDLSQMENFGEELYWLRVRWQGGNFIAKPRLRRLLTNTIWAVQANTITEEILGSSNADPNQVFVANNTPILQGQQLEVEERQIPPELESDRFTVIRDDIGEIEEVWVKWHKVADFYSSGAGDRHYTLDPQTGEIHFGDGIAGMIPPRGRNNIRFFLYRTGGGEQGNIAAETISQLKTTIPYIDRGINLEPSAGGAQQETLDRLKERVPKQLRHRDRAVTAQDMADLAYEASTDVARVKVVTPDMMTSNFSPLDENLWLDPNNPDVSFQDTFNQISGISNTVTKGNSGEIMEEIKRRAGQVKLIILPDSKARQPIPSLALLEQVASYIHSRCEGTVDLVVTAPKWQEISVTVTITPISLEGVDRVRDRVKQRLEVFLHPLTGGSGKGWEFGRYPKESDFYAIIQAIPDVDHVDSLTIDVDHVDSLTIDGVSIETPLSADTLIFSGNHTVYVKG